MHNSRREIDWKAMRRASRLIKSNEFDLEMLGVVADICDFSYRGWFGKFRLIIRRFFFVGIPQEFKGEMHRNIEPAVTLLSSICRDDYVTMINGLEKRLEVEYSCNVSCGTKWKFSNFLSGWVEAYKKCFKYSLIRRNNSLAKNIIALISTAHAIKSKGKLNSLIRPKYNDKNLIVFLMRQILWNLFGVQHLMPLGIKEQFRYSMPTILNSIKKTFLLMRLIILI